MNLPQLIRDYPNDADLGEYIRRNYKTQTMRHKWTLNMATLSKVVDAGVCACTRCGIIKQYVKGVPTYFYPETEKLWDRYAPDCSPATPEPTDAEGRNKGEQIVEACSQLYDDRQDGTHEIVKEICALALEQAKGQDMDLIIKQIKEA